MTGPARLGYAINQWKPNFDDFTRREQHVRALKVIAACGFSGVELRAGTGRWDPLGRPASIAANYGSAAAFTDLLRQIGVEEVCSWYFDPGEPVGEELSPGRSVLEGGLVDFPRLMRALKEHEFTGWITVEHDKANIGGDYAESTALSMWYAKHVLREIYS